MSVERRSGRLDTVQLLRKFDTDQPNVVVEGVLNSSEQWDVLIHVETLFFLLLFGIFFGTSLFLLPSFSPLWCWKTKPFKLYSVLIGSSASGFSPMETEWVDTALRWRTKTMDDPLKRSTLCASKMRERYLDA